MISFRRIQTTDWPKIIGDLEERGLANSTIAIALNIPKTTLQRWKDGSIPNYEDGINLIRLHQQLTG